MRLLFSFLVLIFFGSASFGQHTIVLKNGKKLKGVVLGLENDVLSVAIDREMKTIELMQVSSIFFNEYVPYDGKFMTSEPVKTIQSGKYQIKYQMKDRKMITAPKISNATENRGTVVVDIMINRNGNVMRAKPGGVGSTTTSEYLLTKAKFAAQGAKFDQSTTGPIETEGTIIITY